MHLLGFGKENQNQSNSYLGRPINVSQVSSPYRGMAYAPEEDLKRFSYNTYIQNLQSKLAEYSQRKVPNQSYLEGNAFRYEDLNIDYRNDPFRKDKFRKKILEKLGSVGGFESGPENEGQNDLNGNFADGLSNPSDMDRFDMQQSPN